MQSLICADVNPVLFHFFDLSVAPAPLFYSYIPIIIVSLFLGVYILIKGSFSSQSKVFFGICTFFSLWILDLLFQWIGVYVKYEYFFWQITAFFEVFIPVLTVYFVYLFVDKKSISILVKSILTLVILGTLVLMPTSWNVVSFDVVNCQGIVGPLLKFIYGFELVSAFWVFGFCLSKGRKERDLLLRREQLTLGVGTLFFLLIFSLSNIFGELTQIYEINLIGPIGMVIFLGLMTYMIVEFRLFNIKLLATQVLVIATAILIAARTFYSTTLTGFLLTAVTLIAFLISGVFLIRSVKREIDQRERIETLAQYLEDANERQTTLIHFITHQIKGVLTKAKYIFGELDIGTYGDLPPRVKEVTQQGLNFVTDGVNMVQNILRASNVKTGKVSYKKEPVDFKEVVERGVFVQKKNAERKGLQLDMDTTVGTYRLVGDYEQLSHAVYNLIDNAIKYTPSGSILVSLQRTDTIIRLVVKDSGIGISESDQKYVFIEGGRGEESTKINVDSTGYGLFLVKGIVEAHGGSIRYESEGRGKGTTFTVELPVVGG